MPNFARYVVSALMLVWVWPYSVRELAYGEVRDRSVLHSLLQLILVLLIENERHLLGGAGGCGAKGDHTGQISGDGPLTDRGPTTSARAGLKGEHWRECQRQRADSNART